MVRDRRCPKSTLSELKVGNISNSKARILPLQLYTVKDGDVNQMRSVFPRANGGAGQMYGLRGSLKAQVWLQLRDMVRDVNVYEDSDSDSDMQDPGTPKGHHKPLPKLVFPFRPPADADLKPVMTHIQKKTSPRLGSPLASSRESSLSPRPSPADSPPPVAVVPEPTIKVRGSKVHHHESERPGQLQIPAHPRPRTTKRRSPSKVPGSADSDDERPRRMSDSLQFPPVAPNAERLERIRRGETVEEDDLFKDLQSEFRKSEPSSAIVSAKTSITSDVSYMPRDTVTSRHSRRRSVSIADALFPGRRSSMEPINLGPSWKASVAPTSAARRTVAVQGKIALPVLGAIPMGDESDVPSEQIQPLVHASSTVTRHHVPVSAGKRKVVAMIKNVSFSLSKTQEIEIPRRQIAKFEVYREERGSVLYEPGAGLEPSKPNITKIASLNRHGYHTVRDLKANLVHHSSWLVERQELLLVDKKAALTWVDPPPGYGDELQGGWAMKTGTGIRHLDDDELLEKLPILPNQSALLVMRWAGGANRAKIRVEDGETGDTHTMDIDSLSTAYEVKGELRALIKADLDMEIFISESVAVVPASQQVLVVIPGLGNNQQAPVGKRVTVAGIRMKGPERVDNDELVLSKLKPDMGDTLRVEKRVTKMQSEKHLKVDKRVSKMQSEKHLNPRATSAGRKTTFVKDWDAMVDSKI